MLVNQRHLGRVTPVCSARRLLVACFFVLGSLYVVFLLKQSPRERPQGTTGIHLMLEAHRRASLAQKGGDLRGSAGDQGQQEPHVDPASAEDSGLKGGSPATQGSSEGDRSRPGAKLSSAGLKDAVVTCPNGESYTGGAVYWKDWGPQTAVWSSPYDYPEERFVTFEPDEGGFNNIRMAMETAVMFALATGRMLVVPDEYPMYLLGAKGMRHDFDDFFCFSTLKRRMKVIQMQDFLRQEALTGRLKGGLLPPENRTTFERQRPLWQYIRAVSRSMPGPPEKYVLGFNVSDDIERFAAFSAKRELTEYGPELQAEKVLHFTTHSDGGVRWLVHWYAWLFFSNEAVDRYMKRFARDYLHYNENIYCPALSAIERIKSEADDGSYSAIHVRRGDFQFKETRLDAKTMFGNVEDLLPDGGLVYVLTDEKNRSFFDPVAARYRLRFLSDYISPGEHRNYLGMIEQVIASGAEVFVGAWQSTLSSYITRLRGFQGRDPGFYYMLDKKYELQNGHFYATPPFFRREWPVAHTDIE